MHYVKIITYFYLSSAMLYVFPTGLYRYNLFAEQLSLDASHTTLKKPVRSSPRAYIFLASINYLKPQAFSY